MSYAKRPNPLNRSRLSGWLKRLLPDNLRGNKPFVVGEHFRQTRSGVDAPVGWTLGSAPPAGARWILSRGCYAVRNLELAAVPSAKREAAIRLAIAGWTPFAETAHYIVPNGESALLCAWDAAETGRQIATYAPDAEIEVVPEAALRPLNSASSPVIPAALLVPSLDGCVGVVAVKDRTLAEQWWPDLPTPLNWRNFLRGAGLETAADNILPPLEVGGWRQTPIGYPANRRATTVSAAEMFGIWLVAILLAVPTAWYANELRQVAALKRAASERLLATERDLDAVLTAREAALTTQDRAAKLAELFDQPDHLQLFATVNDVLTQSGAQASLQLADWEVRAQQLKFTLVANSGTPPAATVLVRALERVQTFRDVEAKVDGSRVNVTLRLLPPQSNSSAPVAPTPAAPTLKQSSTHLLPEAARGKCSQVVFAILAVEPGHG
jgi:hypothetical protein